MVKKARLGSGEAEDVPDLSLPEISEYNRGRSARDLDKGNNGLGVSGESDLNSVVVVVVVVLGSNWGL